MAKSVADQAGISRAGLPLGEALRARRKGLGISMTAAAEAARISRVTWHRLEKGETTVALGSLLAAAEALGLHLRLEDPAANTSAPDLPAGFLPLHIALQEFPQLERLAWQVQDGTHALSPREAFGLYQRNWRHLDVGALDSGERALIHALRDTFGGDWPGV
ncbi:MAG: helix-turn-helix domain-containing protein [Burkholderiales bacterium]|nr:helix-turn-helix domain-containing protein [Burkholderiales bacterium]